MLIYNTGKTLPGDDAMYRYSCKICGAYFYSHRSMSKEIVEASHYLWCKGIACVDQLELDDVTYRYE